MIDAFLITKIPKSDKMYYKIETHKSYHTLIYFCIPSYILPITTCNIYIYIYIYFLWRSLKFKMKKKKKKRL